MKEKQALAFNLKRLRQFKGLTQEELAKKVGLTKDTISKIELGKQENIGLKYLSSICQTLGIDMEQLFIKDLKSIPINFFVSDRSVHALGEIIKQAQKILKKQDKKIF